MILYRYPGIPVGGAKSDGALHVGADCGEEEHRNNNEEALALCGPKWGYRVKVQVPTTVEAWRRIRVSRLTAFGQSQSGAICKNECLKLRLAFMVRFGSREMKLFQVFSVYFAH